jgi:hypothetical protein
MQQVCRTMAPVSMLLLVCWSASVVGTMMLR